MTTDRIGELVHKTLPATILKVDNGSDGGPGGFDALVAVFDNIDAHGDKVISGAFTESIEAHKSAPFPVLWAHQFHDETAIIGTATAEETSDGLVFHAEFLPMTRAQNIRTLMDKGLITEFSWSGKIQEGTWVDAEGEGLWGDGFYEIRSVDLWEAGPCFKGANPETELLSVKSAVEGLATKEGRILAQKHVDTLKAISSQLADVIKTVDTTEAETEEEKSESPPSDSKIETEALDDSGAFSMSKTLARLRLA